MRSSRIPDSARVRACRSSAVRPVHEPAPRRGAELSSARPERRTTRLRVAIPSVMRRNTYT
eukprot:12772464-Alexandrium_andersonii.AAC.1